MTLLQRYEEQLAEWKETELTLSECQQMENLGRQLAKLREMMIATLAVARDLKGGAAESS